ncbi:MAG: dihydrofolate reductase family protein, partial [Leptospiraceae bacterium]|nr:dihydrofolate reductase family protein [Leptospiraceae bacterium]
AGHLKQRAELHFSDALSPSDILSELHHRQYDRILLEGGPTLNASYFAADLVDRLFITIVPYILGQNDLPGIVKMQQCMENFDQRSWTLVQCEKIENEIFTEYHRSKN